MADEVTAAQYEGLKKQINDIAKTIDLRFQEWSEDRKSITDLEVRLKTIEAKLEGTRDDLADQTKKVLDKMDEHLQPIPDVLANQVKDSIDNIKQKKWYNLFTKKKGSE